ncbi:hypothetical protein [Bauldia sp.]|uniref:hypothetical protein n=1 Tax=Bauldia sp. TaxID=2575872 RepID=UPI003BA933E7
MPKQKDDVFAIGSPAITFSKPNQKWRIEKTVTVSSDVDAVFSEYVGSTLVNKGHIQTLGGDGVLFVENEAEVVNKATGLIAGDNGVRFTGTDNVEALLVNDGQIVGTNVGVWDLGRGDFRAENHGQIFGTNVGLEANASGAGSTSGPVIHNYGSIESEATGVNVAAAPGLRCKIVNHEGAVIKGSTLSSGIGDGAVHNAMGDMILINKGKIKGDIFSATSGKDTITNTGKIKGTVLLGSGNDTLDNRDGKITGYITGEDGKDKLIAGDAKEKFFFAIPADGTNIDRVKKFESGKDKFIFAEGVFGDLTDGPLAKSAFRRGTEAEDDDDRIIYDKDSGKLYIDDDGVGGNPHFQFAKVDPGQTLKYSDFTVELFAA